MNAKQVEKALRIANKTFVRVDIGGKTIELPVLKGLTLEVLWDMQERKDNSDIPASIEGSLESPESLRLVIG